MTTCPTGGRKVLSHACYVQCRSCCEYYHMKCISLERNMQDDIHNSKCDWLCSNCLADIFPFNQIEDENEFIDECQLRMKASLKFQILSITPLNPIPQMTVYVQILTQTSIFMQKKICSVDTHVDIILRINSMKNWIHCILTMVIIFQCATLTYEVWRLIWAVLKIICSRCLLNLLFLV